jgi:aconitase B
MLLPDQVGTGGDSHPRFALDMPESIRVKFTGEM